jgi:hypothetical protein
MFLLRLRSVGVAASCALLPTVAACGDDSADGGAGIDRQPAPADEARPEPEVRPDDDPVVLAEEFLAGFDIGWDGERDITPESVAFLDYVSRRWARPEVVDTGEALALLGESDDLIVFGRFFDSMVTVDEQAAWTVAQPMGAALHCDDHGFPPGYADRLRSEVDSGGYLATHVLLVVGWAAELGCDLPDGDQILADAVDRVADELGDTDEVTDLSAQQIAFLDYAGALDRVDPAWHDRLVESQQGDGGWPEDPTSGFGRWHTAGTAWWSLLALEDSGDRRTAMIAGG